MPNLDAWSPRVLSILRIITALLFMEHGLMKMFHFPAPQPGVPDPLPTILMAAAWIEIVGGSLIALGLFTRAAAFICSGQMAVAYFMAHNSQNPWPGLNQGDAAIGRIHGEMYMLDALPRHLNRKLPNLNRLFHQ